MRAARAFFIDLAGVGPDKRARSGQILERADTVRSCLKKRGAGRAFVRAGYPAEAAKATAGGVPEWLKGTDCKSVGLAYVGSNPTPSTNRLLASACGPDAAKPPLILPLRHSS